MVEKLNRSSCLIKFCWLGIIAQAVDQCWSVLHKQWISVEVVANSLGRLAFADRHAWLVDLGQRERCCTREAAATLDECYSSWVRVRVKCMEKEKNPILWPPITTNTFCHSLSTLLYWHSTVSSSSPPKCCLIVPLGSSGLCQILEENFMLCYHNFETPWHSSQLPRHS